MEEINTIPHSASKLPHSASHLPPNCLNLPHSASKLTPSRQTTYCGCGKSFSRKDNLRRHQLKCKQQNTTANLNNNDVEIVISQSTPINPSIDYICKYCETQFKHKSSMSRHEGKCKGRNNDADMHKLVDLLNKQLEHQRTQIEKERTEHSKQIEAYLLNYKNQSHATVA